MGALIVAHLWLSHAAAVLLPSYCLVLIARARERNAQRWYESRQRYHENMIDSLLLEIEDLEERAK